MGQYIIRRLLTLIPVLLGVSLIVFAMLKFVPGDPARMVAGPDATQEDLDNVRRSLGLDQPLYVQYGRFLWNAVRGDLGRSIRSRRPVSDEIGDRFPATAELALVAFTISVIVGTAAGIISATKQYSIWDNLAMVGALAGVSMPVFWLGLMLMLVFGVQLGWLPTSGRGTLGHVILPALTMGLASAAIVARQTRSAMLEVLRQEYIRTARAKGLRERVVIMRHALKNAAIPSVTIIGLQIGFLISGAVVTETVFAWPGLGRLIVESIGFRDLPVVQGAILLLATVFVVVNLLVDVSYAYLDPRIRYN